MQAAPATGSLYAVILFGIILVFQVSRSINFAYGPTGMLGTFASYGLYGQLGLPVWFPVLIGIEVTVMTAAIQSSRIACTASVE
jgi:branched-chain amino acid transport system permease protein